MSNVQPEEQKTLVQTAHNLINDDKNLKTQFTKPLCVSLLFPNGTHHNITFDTQFCTVKDIKVYIEQHFGICDYHSVLMDCTNTFMDVCDTNNPLPDDTVIQDQQILYVLQEPMQLFKDMFVDVCDTFGVWMEAQILEITNTHIQVHFLLWDSRWDECISLHDTHRIAPLRKKTFNGVSHFRLNQSMDVLDIHCKTPKWRSACIIEMCKDSVKIHYKHFHPKFDEWICKTSDRLACYGQHSKSNLYNIYSAVLDFPNHCMKCIG